MDPRLHNRSRNSALPIRLTGCALLMLGMKLWLAATTFGTNDVYAFEKFLTWSRLLGVQLYHVAKEFNHPPSMIHVLQFMGWLSSVTALPFAFWLRLPGILADAGSLWLVWDLLARRATDKIRWPIVLMAVAPVSLMVSGFHGNTDPVMMFFLLLSVWLTEKRNAIALAGVALGVSMSFKVVPLVVLPVMFFYHRDLRSKIKFFGALGLTLSVTWQPFLVQDPWQVSRQVFGYGSSYGIWGVGYLATRVGQWSHALQWINPAFRHGGPYLLLGTCCLAAFWMNRATERPRLFSQVGFIFMLFLAVSSGFGVQYLAWLVPWVVELGAVTAAIYYAASGFFLFGVYNSWAQGMPWYLADANRFGDFPWSGYLDLFMLIAWASVLWALFVAWTRLRDGSAAGRSAVGSHVVVDPGWGAGIAAAGTAMAVFLGVQSVALQRAGAAAHATLGPAALVPIRTDMYLGLSRELYQLHRYQEAMAAADEALKLSPASAAAANLKAASRAAMGGSLERRDSR